MPPPNEVELVSLENLNHFSPENIQGGFFIGSDEDNGKPILARVFKRLGQDAIPPGPAPMKRNWLRPGNRLCHFYV